MRDGFGGGDGVGKRSRGACATLGCESFELPNFRRIESNRDCENELYAVVTSFCDARFGVISRGSRYCDDDDVDDLDVNVVVVVGRLFSNILLLYGVAIPIGRDISYSRSESGGGLRISIRIG